LSPNFNKHFILYTFIYDIEFVIVLTYKNDEGNEFSISFMSSRLQGEKLNYPEVDKKEYVVLKKLNTLGPTCSNPKPN
jgi:hypothetical protein